MRFNLLGALLLFTIVPLAIGCQQTNAPITSPLTPASPYSASNQLAPIQRTSGIGPLGGSTRVPPPATNSFTVPNNYMGGTAPVGSASITQPYNGFTNVGTPNNSPVEQAGFAGSGIPGNQNLTAGGAFRSGPNFNTGPNFNAGPQSSTGPQLANTADSILRPQSGGMRVIDLTDAPAPPGYTPPSFSPQFPANQIAANQFPANQAAALQQAPAGFANTSGFVDRNIAPTSYVSPNNVSPNNNAQFFPSQPPRIATVPYGTSPSSIALDQQQMPSTEPLNSGPITNSDQLQWRRPTSQF